MAMNRLLLSALLVGASVFPAPLSAQVVVSEFMYDLAEGSDTGREWVEVFNQSGSSVDLTTWKLFESEVNHKISEFQGGAILSSGGYAIVADNPVKFLIDWPSYGGLLFDSTFSLGNSGENFVLRNADSVDVDTVSYLPEMGAAGDGNALVRSGGGFAAAAPTPGSGPLQVTGSSSDALSENTDNASQTIEENAPVVNAATNFPVEPQLFAYAGKDRGVLVGADVIFEGQALSKSGEILEGVGVRYLWNFGDGVTSEDRIVAHHFAYPGTYTVFLDVASGKYSANDRVVIVARDPQLVLSRMSDGGVRIENLASVEVDISFWHVKVGEAFFSIPKHTIILPRGTVTLRQDATHLPPGEPVLVYPNGIVAVSGSEIKTGTESLLTHETPPRAVQATPSVERATTQSVIGMPFRAVTEVGTDEPIEEADFEVLRAATSSAQTASAAGSRNGQSDLWLWLLGLMGAIGVGGVAFMFAIEGAKGPLTHEGWVIEEDSEVR